MSFGLTTDGFQIKRLEDIITDIETDLQNEFGELDTSADSALGQIIGAFAKQAADVWEVLENTYNSNFPNTAEGVSLDNVVLYNSITRQASIATQVIVSLEGSEGTIITAGHRVSASSSSENYLLVTETLLTEASLTKTLITITNVSDTEIYKIVINGTEYTYNAWVGATKDDMAGFISAQLEIDLGSSYNTDWTVSEEFFTLDIVDKTESFSASVTTTTNHELTQIWTPAIYNSEELGPVSTPVSSINTIETPIFGLESVTNFTEGIEGRDEETDTELRTRREESLQIVGLATVEAIRSRILQDVENVVSVTVIHNPEDTDDIDGRPPHSFEVIVSGGDDQEIADKIWEVAPAGIQTFGTETENVTDSMGNNQSISFSRPTSKPVYMDVELTLNPEETFPTGGETQLEEDLASFGTSEFDIGDDVIVQKFFGTIFAVNGISSAVIKLDFTPSPVNTGNLTIASDETSTFDVANINVSIP